MLNLQPCIHLDEEEFPVFIKEFHRADTKIAHAPGRLGGHHADLGALGGSQCR